VFLGRAAAHPLHHRPGVEGSAHTTPKAFHHPGHLFGIAVPAILYHPGHFLKIAAAKLMTGFLKTRISGPFI